MIPTFIYEDEIFDTEDHSEIGRYNEIALIQLKDEVFYNDRLTLN